MKVSNSHAATRTYLVHLYLVLCTLYGTDVIYRLTSDNDIQEIVLGRAEISPPQVVSCTAAHRKCTHTGTRAEGAQLENVSLCTTHSLPGMRHEVGTTQESYRYVRAYTTRTSLSAYSSSSAGPSTRPKVYVQKHTKTMVFLKRDSTLNEHAHLSRDDSWLLQSVRRVVERRIEGQTATTRIYQAPNPRRRPDAMH